MIRVSRAYDKPELTSARYLVERLWPRGIRRNDLRIDGWLRDVAPSDELRRWFAHDPTRWDEFRRRYFAELDQRPEAWRPLIEAARRGDVTLVFSARDTQNNNAVALKDYLDGQLPRKPKRVTR